MLLKMRDGSSDHHVISFGSFFQLHEYFVHPQFFGLYLTISFDYFMWDLECWTTCHGLHNVGWFTFKDRVLIEVSLCKRFLQHYRPYTSSPAHIHECKRSHFSHCYYWHHWVYTHSYKLSSHVPYCGVLRVSIVF